MSIASQSSTSLIRSGKFIFANGDVYEGKINSKKYVFQSQKNL